MKIDKDQLELRIDEPWVPAEEFKAIFKEFLGLVAEVSDSVTGQHDAFSWSIAVESGSNVIRLKPLPKNAPAQVIPLALCRLDEGLSEIAHRRKRPEHFSDKALKHVERLAEFSKRDGQSVERLSIIGPQNERVSLKDLNKSIESMLAKPVESWGSVTGRLLVLSARKHDAIYIDDELTSQPIRCILSEDIDASVMAAFRKRVTVEGLIRYSGDGLPTSVKIVSSGDIRVLKEQEELPGFKDVLGIFNKV